MEEEGFIKYYQADPNPKLFGFKSMAVYAFQTEDIPSKYKALKYFETAPWVLEIADTFGPSISAVLVGDSEEQVEKMAGEISDKLKLEGWFKINTRDLAEPTLLPQKLDWQIIKSLRYDALCSIKEIAQANSITPRMAEYRITKLQESKILFIRAVINAQKQQGILFYNLAIVTEDAKQSSLVDKLKEKHSERIWILLIPDPTVILAGFFAMTPSEPEDTMMKVRELDEVLDCFLSIFKEFIEARRPNWVETLIERAIAEQAATVSTETELRN